jgi:hypothetical protein
MDAITSNLPLLVYLLSLIILIVILSLKTRRLGEKNLYDPTHDEIEKTLKKLVPSDKKLFTRTLDDERVFMEDLLIKRFTFLLTIFSIFFAASGAIKDDLFKSVVLLIGAGLCYAMSISVKRAHYKHHWIMRVLYGLGGVNYSDELADWQNHPVKLINEAMVIRENNKKDQTNKDIKNKDNRSEVKRKKSKGSVSNLNGYLLPNLTFTVLLITAIYFAANSLYKTSTSGNEGKAEVLFLDVKGKIQNFNGEVYIKDQDNYLIINDSLKIYKVIINK